MDMGLARKTTMGRPFILLSIEGADWKLVVGAGERGDSNEKRVVGHQHQHGICVETPLGPFQSAQLGVSLRNWESRCEIGPHFWELKNRLIWLTRFFGVTKGMNRLNSSRVKQ